MMNARAQKKARQAELEFELLAAWYDWGQEDFVEWLQHKAYEMGNSYYAMAKELIALYEDETL